MTDSPGHRTLATLPVGNIWWDTGPVRYLCMSVCFNLIFCLKSSCSMLLTGGMSDINRFRFAKHKKTKINYPCNAHFVSFFEYIGPVYPIVCAPYLLSSIYPCASLLCLTFEEFVDFLVTTTFRNLPKFWINCEQRGISSKEGLDHVLI